MSSNLFETILIAGAGAAVGIFGYRAYVKDESPDPSSEEDAKDKTELDKYMESLEDET